MLKITVLTNLKEVLFMEKPGYVAPAYPIQPMSIPAPMPMPAPMPAYAPPPPVMPSPIHNDIHLHASYQQTEIFLPYHKKHHHHHFVNPYNTTGGILVLFILLVIITRSLHSFKC
jgi:hypothetical protein